MALAVPFSEKSVTCVNKCGTSREERRTPATDPVALVGDPLATGATALPTGCQHASRRSGHAEALMIS